MEGALGSTAGCWWGEAISKGPVSPRPGGSEQLRLERWVTAGCEGADRCDQELRPHPGAQCFSN